MKAMRTFLSYDSRDCADRRTVASSSRAQKLNVWDPAREIYPGSNWLLEAGRAFERADAVIFLISEHSVDTPALRREVQYAITNLRFKDRVVPVILSGDVKNIPWILQKMDVIDAVDRDMDRVAKSIATGMRRSRIETRSVHSPAVRRRDPQDRRPPNECWDDPLRAKSSSSARRLSPKDGKIKDFWTES